MASKDDLKKWVVDALLANGRRASLTDVAKHIWAVHEQDLRASGDLFYTWQYDMRWAANSLRKRDVMKPVVLCPPGIWELWPDSD